jgi:hypothetical protein
MNISSPSIELVLLFALALNVFKGIRERSLNNKSKKIRPARKTSFNKFRTTAGNIEKLFVIILVTFSSLFSMQPPQQQMIAVDYMGISLCLTSEKVVFLPILKTEIHFTIDNDTDHVVKLKQEKIILRTDSSKKTTLIKCRLTCKNLEQPKHSFDLPIESNNTIKIIERQGFLELRNFCDSIAVFKLKQ